MTGLDNSRYGAAATAAPVLTASARPRPVPGLSSRGAWPRRTSRLLAFRKGGSFHASWVEKRKSFVHLFKGGGVWGETPRPYRGAGGPGARWAPFRAGLRCHFGRCWASATGRQHPRRQPRPEATAFSYFKKGGTDVPLLGWHKSRCPRA